LVATHDLDVAARIAERVLVLHEGRIAAQGTLEEVLGVGEGQGGLPRKLLRLLEAPETEAALS
jgi:ABC-type glutathione transport system ATPase component